MQYPHDPDLPHLPERSKIDIPFLKTNTLFDQEMKNAMHGFWAVKSYLMPEEDEIIFISASRFVHLPIVSEGPPPKRIPVRLWCEKLENDDFLVTLDPKVKGWKLSMWMDQQDLMVHNGTKEFRCQRVDESDVSESSKTAVSKANEKMDSIEEEKQAGASDGDKPSR